MTQRTIRVLAVAAFCGSMAFAGTFTFNGVFTQDDQRASFAVILNSPQQVTLLTTQYANGGFAP
ncbi:MAG TPA: DVUA0089 family protein, partial [Candidatus Sulfopaludibacter sp.]|nr:DVUA0089 family protein [Candidatus Sulfopaludibacter sp.]